ncbi:MAG: hypothetical protein D3922_08790 [Candidatus Electrothrix sp. AR1]|nr:hypothetical protein [Candidatus Electrothrix sp. AR1]
MLIVNTEACIGCGLCETNEKNIDIPSPL